MMKHKMLSVVGAGLLVLTVWSCREQSDALMGYDQNEILVFGASDTSFVAKFDVLWNGLNQYYAIWDYEREEGVDWDAVYDEFLPQFEALDKRDSVPDDELKGLMQKFLSPLHDGHLQFQVKNHTTGSTVEYIPNIERILQREDLAASLCEPSLRYYADVAHGEVETDADGNPIVKECSTVLTDIAFTFFNTPGKGYRWINDKIQELDSLSSPTEMQAFQLQGLKNLRQGIYAAAAQPETFVPAYNSLWLQYSYLDIPGFDYIAPAFADKAGIKVMFALLKGNIAYFRLNSFCLSSFLEDKQSQSTFDMSEPATRQYVERVREVWRSWFDSVQQLHQNGTLGGVIIDVRSKGGGDMNDSQYVVGSLLPAGGIHFGYQRYKRGTGRYEYSPMMAAQVLTISEPHETITEPIVILTNCQSISMSETSVLCVKTLTNGTQIGKRSWGAICALTDNVYHTYNYSGYIGVKGVTPVFCNVPSMASFTLDKQLIESQGITPDIEVDLDVDLFNATGQDTQLDRALQFIRTGR